MLNLVQFPKCTVHLHPARVWHVLHSAHVSFLVFLPIVLLILDLISGALCSYHILCVPVYSLSHTIMVVYTAISLVGLGTL